MREMIFAYPSAQSGSNVQQPHRTASTSADSKTSDLRFLTMPGGVARSS